MSWVLIAAASIVSGVLGAMGLGGGGILLLVLDSLVHSRTMLMD